MGTAFGLSLFLCRFRLSKNPPAHNLCLTARVAQLDRASASEAEGCGFNSRHAHHSCESVNTVGGVVAIRFWVDLG